jgi:hypothetical protein
MHLDLGRWNCNLSESTPQGCHNALVVTTGIEQFVLASNIEKGNIWGRTKTCTPQVGTGMRCLPHPPIVSIGALGGTGGIATRHMGLTAIAIEHLGITAIAIENLSLGR